jgi:5-methylcytosine-specific restriction endonuclease McrA
MVRPRIDDGLCAYCGRFLATTIDHVIPRCLFIPPLPQSTRPANNVGR